MIIAGKFIAVIVIGYLLGAIPFGVLVGRLRSGVDVREYGSGSTGVANVLRTAGRVGEDLSVRQALPLSQPAAPVGVTETGAD